MQTHAIAISMCFLKLKTFCILYKRLPTTLIALVPAEIIHNGTKFQKKVLILDFNGISFHKYYLKYQQLFSKNEIGITDRSAYKKVSYKPGF